ncbi:MAG TPA: zinc ABC transporter substrate-binding protein [Acidimicrobiales bacterium]|nr:zinc ABC transporter substrate-binding protein [Acidimicrobiales bacterium]
MGTSRPRRSAPGNVRSLAAGTGLLVAAVLAGCTSAGTPSTTGVVQAVGAENEYADVLAQIGGPYVHVSSIIENPNTDPHAFESSPSVAREVSAAELVVQNGLGYDAFMAKIESASASATRKVIVVQRLLGLPDSTPNPHLWYDPATMPKVARAMANALAALRPAHASFFQASLQSFDRSLTPWTDAIAAFKARFAGTPVATTEPVADYLLEAMGLDNRTPFAFQADVMNGTDPAPQDVTLEDGFFTGHQVKVFCYNQQVVSSLTASILQNAQRAGVPVVGVYETMPTPGYHYQSWMLAEVQAIEKAVAGGVSTGHL